MCSALVPLNYVLFFHHISTGQSLNWIKKYMHAKIGIGLQFC